MACILVDTKMLTARDAVDSALAEMRGCCPEMRFAHADRAQVASRIDDR